MQPTASSRVLDIGGAPNTWLAESDGDASFPVTMVNLVFPDPAAHTHARFSVVVADATKMPLADASFDIAYSNSVIEHMVTLERQQAFASEARRVADALWVQTPARSFPIEPHVIAPFFQFLPAHWQQKLARRCTLWGLLTKPDEQQIREFLHDIRLLSFKEMQLLFPGCTILRERFCGFTKSYIAVSLPQRNG